MRPKTVLIVDDEPDIRQIVGEILRDEGLNVETAENADVARDMYNKHSPDLVLVDIWMPDTDGITLLKEWKVRENSPPVVMMSGHGTVETAVESVRAGAYDFLEKPLSHAKLLVTVERALESRYLKDQNLLLRNRLEPVSVVCGRSSAMEALRRQIGKVGPTDSWPLISGESGSGKSVTARAIHQASLVSGAPFAEIRISSMANHNAALSLFGQEKNGVIRSGVLEDANHGTLALDDISNLDLGVQDQLLEVLETKSFCRLGGNETIKTNIRFIAITNQNLEEKIAAGHFREKLYKYFCDVSIWVPPLRQHREDIPELVDYYSKIIIDSEHLPFRRFSTAAVNLIRNGEWSGNVRELRNAVQQLLLSARNEEIDLQETRVAINSLDRKVAENRPSPYSGDYDQPLRQAREEFERSYFIHHLEKVTGNMTELANRSGMERTHLYRKLKSLGIDPKSIKDKQDHLPT